MIAQQHQESPAIRRLLDNLNADWEELRGAAEEKGERLRQAEEQKSLKGALDDVHLRLDEVHNELHSQDLG